MPSVIFVAPFLMPATQDFVAATAELPGVRLGLITQQPAEHLSQELKARLEAHWRVDNALDPGQLVAAVRQLERQLGPIHRLMGALEQLQEPLAEARQVLGIEGMNLDTARNFRQKARMKTVLRAAGLPCARHRLAETPAEALDFARQVGYPLVLKPPAGAGAQGTFRVDSDAELAQGLEFLRPAAGAPLLLEEFIVGQEFSFETISIRGEPVWSSMTHYHPTPLEVLQNPWIQWCVLLPREIHAPPWEDIAPVGFPALKALGLQTGLTHMEWFRRRDGSVAISEVAARPPGAQITSLVSWAHEVNFKRVWAHVMVYDELQLPPRKFATGAAFLRGQGRGKVRAVWGLDQAQQELGPLVVEAKLPQVGQAQASSYEGEGYVILRHEDTEVVSRALRRLVTLVRVELG